MRVSKLDNADGSLEFIGEDKIDHTPKDEQVRVKLGSAFDVVGERRQVDFTVDTTAKWMEEEIEVKLRNHKSQPVEVMVKENLYRWSNWKVLTQDAQLRQGRCAHHQFPGDGARRMARPSCAIACATPGERCGAGSAKAGIDSIELRFIPVFRDAGTIGTIASRPEPAPKRVNLRPDCTSKSVSWRQFQAHRASTHMNLTETSLRNPAGVLVAILMVALLGIFALVKLPIQLFPNIEEPVISIFTTWRAAAPTEIESEIIEPQERALQGLRGMQSLNAFANAGQRVPQPAVRGRHRHAGDDARSHQPHEPAAADAARRAGAADLAGRGRRQRP